MEKTYFTERRTIRKFSDKEVPDEMLRSILERAMKAPTTGNLQLYSVVVTRSEKNREALAKLHFSQPAAKTAPVLLTVCADLYRFKRWTEVRRADYGFDNFMSFTSAFADAMIYAQQIVTIAESEGLGTCYLGTTLYNSPEIARLLNVPARVVPVAGIALGWPDEKGVETERLEVDCIIQEEEYRRLTEDDVIRIFKVKEEFEPNKRFVEENNKENLAQVFAEVRYPRSMNEELSRKLLRFLDGSNLL